MGSAFSKNSFPLTDISSLDGRKYDYVIIGGGTAGCVLASRLSEDPNVSVLLLEAGKRSTLIQISHTDAFFSKIPLAFTKLFKTEFDWNFETTEQEHLDGRHLYWPRGKLLGGSSSINAMMYHHCSPSDFDEWQRLLSSGSESGGANAPKWAYSNLHPYFIKSEHFQVPEALQAAQSEGQVNSLHNRDPSLPDSHDDINLLHRGEKGPWRTRLPTVYNQICQDAVRACEQVGIPYTPDFNTPDGTLGTAMFPGFVDEKGHRSSAATAYLTPEVVARKNLTVAIKCLTTRLVFENDGQSGSSGAQPKVVGVEVTHSSQTKTQKRCIVRCNKEVIVSAGAICTPQLLMISGIGPRKDLEEHEIEVLVENNNVGRNLIDHLCTGVYFRAAPKSTLAYLDSPISGVTALLKWLTTGGGIYGSIAPQGAAFIRTDDTTLPFESAKQKHVLPVKDATSGPRAPDMELIWLAAPYLSHGQVDPPKGVEIFTMAAVMLRPQSRGTIKLLDKDATVFPLIDPHYLENENDKNAMVKSLRLMLRIARTEPLASKLNLQSSSNDKSAANVLWPGDADPEDVTDEELAEYLRRNAETLYHPVGTARMGTSAESSVVDPWLRVHGVSGLRVVDASIFPMQLSGHPTAPIIAVAERAAEIIKGNTKS